MRVVRCFLQTDRVHSCYHMHTKYERREQGEQLVSKEDFYDFMALVKQPKSTRLIPTIMQSNRCFRFCGIFTNDVHLSANPPPIDAFLLF
jgi:hypothetical protein